MRIAVFGSGGVGGYFGGRLVESGNDVTFVARGEHLEALQNAGIKIVSPKGNYEGPVHATDDISTIGVVDLVIIGTKAWQVEDAARSIAPIVGTNTAVLPLQNGVDAACDLKKTLGDKPVLGGLCRIISYVSQPGEITHLGADPTIVFGELDGSRSDRCGTIDQTLNNARGMQAELTEDIQAALWRKFVFMPPVSSIGAVTRAPLGIIRQITETRNLLVAAMREVEALASASGVQLPPNVVDATMAFIDTLPENTTASMQRDVADGKPSELEAQTGAVVRIGQELAIPVPVHTVLYHVLLPLELRTRGKVAWKNT